MHQHTITTAQPNAHSHHTFPTHTETNHDRTNLYSTGCNTYAPPHGQPNVRSAERGSANQFAWFNRTKTCPATPTNNPGNKQMARFHNSKQNKQNTAHTSTTPLPPHCQTTKHMVRTHQHTTKRTTWHIRTQHRTAKTKP